MIKSNAANLITSLRIAFSIALLFCPVFSVGFYVLYVAAGITDMADGAVARKTHTQSLFGSVFDTAADAAFFTICLIKLLPKLDLPLWLWFWIGVIAFVKVVNIVCGLVMRKRFVSLHTAMNKVTGLLLFSLPLTLSLVDLKYSAPVVCAAATLAAVQEGHFTRSGREE